METQLSADKPQLPKGEQQLSNGSVENDWELNISENWTPQLIKKCINLGMIAKVKRDECCFMVDKNDRG